MRREWTRRDMLVTIGATLTAACAPSTSLSAPPASEHPSEGDALAKIEAAVGGRIGVFALDTGSGHFVAHRADERFALCSTFKWALAAGVLARVDRGALSLDERIPYGQADLLEHAPTTRAHVADGSMTVGALARAAVTQSDNTAANLLLAKVGGPPGLTEFIRQVGDSVTRIDRNEPALNTIGRGDVRDTTSPHAMAGLLRSVLCGDVLSRGGRETLIAWLNASETGRDRLRAGFPANWAVGDKTGTGPNGEVNDCAFVVPPGRAPIVIASYFSDGPSPLPALNAAHADVGRLVAKRLS